ncbi:hypothetical protein M8C21_001352 [Ambrosia artemisiifolia]|uniref:Uncharacterized protein n=1 Tax=Ambrosia artemisiifolia TaxID=4212 RepID=A0AAD5C2C6_AMBAR|nr:hypothetical protein M8C21_001352 [Ambrosia artemisiifolia]
MMVFSSMGILQPLAILSYYSYSPELNEFVNEGGASDAPYQECMHDAFFGFVLTRYYYIAILCKWEASCRCYTQFGLDDINNEDHEEEEEKMDVELQKADTSANVVHADTSHLSRKLVHFPPRYIVDSNSSQQPMDANLQHFQI